MHSLMPQKWPTIEDGTVCWLRFLFITIVSKSLNINSIVGRYMISCGLMSLSRVITLVKDRQLHAVSNSVSIMLRQPRPARIDYVLLTYLRGKPPVSESSITHFYLIQ